MEDEIHEATAALVTALERGDVPTACEVYADGARLLTGDDGSWQRAVEVFNPDEPGQARRTLGKEKP